MKKNILFILILISASIWGCEKAEISPESDDFIHVNVEGAQLPVLIRGNTASNKILVFIQGGPGGSAIDYAMVDYAGWKNSLEKDYAIAYYDQRGIGNAQGHFDKSSISLDQYLIDLHHICLVLKDRYPAAEIILFGHSFGGGLSYQYLLKYGNASAADKCIAMDGPASTDYNDQRWVFRRDYLINISEEFIAAGEDVEWWTEALTWAESKPVISGTEEKRKWNEYVLKAVVEQEVSISARDAMTVLFASSYNPIPAYLSSSWKDVVERLFEDLKTIHILDDLHQIDQPILLISGRYDDLVPPEEMRFIYDQISSEDKQLVIIPNAGHEPFLDDPEAFNQAVRAFLE